jgi:hypothetical protein
MPNYEPLFYWVREREAIRIRKDSGLPYPWTNDPVLLSERFCNVRREDDTGTVWIREHIRSRFAGYPFLWLMLCIARQINWPDTLSELIDEGTWPFDANFSPASMTVVLNRRKASGDKVYTGAYMISAPHDKGADKQAYICEQAIGQLWQRRREFAANNDRVATLESVHSQLTETKGWGMFMAYQAVVDMRFTPLLSNAPDVLTWAAAGPGTLRGLNRIYGRELKAPLSQAQALTEMRLIYAIVQQETGVSVDFSDIPNILCETDKYLRVKLGEGKTRARYVPGRGS